MRDAHIAPSHLSPKKQKYIVQEELPLNYQTALFCEFNKYAAESYCAVHGVDPSLNIGDITQADETVVPDFNVMFGGSPCQDFSIAGKQGGLHGAVKTAVIFTTP